MLKNQTRIDELFAPYLRDDMSAEYREQVIQKLLKKLNKESIEVLDKNYDIIQENGWTIDFYQKVLINILKEKMQHIKL